MTRITYDHGQIDALTSEVTSTSKYLADTLGDLRSYLAPLVAEWSGKAAENYGVHQRRWDEAADGLQQILQSLGAAAGAGNQQMHEADAAAARGWS